MTLPPQQAWHAISAQNTLQVLNANEAAGLTAAEASARLAKYGPNQLTEKPRPGFWARFIAQFQNFVIYILIFAIIVSFLLGDHLEAVVISAIVILNAILGVVQEGRAERALEALKKLAAPDARCRRDGTTQIIPASQLVPGDIVLIEAGDFIPADLRLLGTANLKIEEAALTGESVATEKHVATIDKGDSSLGDRHNMAYMGTMVTYGRGHGVVIGTGMTTEMGKIAGMLDSTEEEETPLQKRLNALGKTLSIAALVICGVVFAMNVVQSAIHGEDLLFSLKESFIVAISLAIAAVPEGLPAIVTINLALGMREMIRRNALIRRLPAVETLGSATVICSDKTGTLTQNQMTVTSLYLGGERIMVTGEGYTPQGEFKLSGAISQSEVDQMLTGMLLCSDARLEPASDKPGGYRMVGDPTEGALVVAAAKAGIWREATEEKLPRVNEVPFDSDRKRMATIHRSGDQFAVYVKGAPDLLLELCLTVHENGSSQPLTPERLQKIQQANVQMASEALRVLGLARRVMPQIPDVVTPENIETELEFLGLIGLRDPARPEVKPAIEIARKAGIRTVMITGDYPDTAHAIGAEIGLLRQGGEVLRGAEIETLSDKELAERMQHTDICARVSPHHKVRIVQAFQSQNEVVAMTGDGVNDAPALKRAAIGVAMGITGTDVSKEAADMILTDDNYASIVSAVEQGRIIYSNIRKFVYYLLTCNLAEIGVIFCATLLGWGTPLTAIQLLWLNLVTDGAPALALGVEKGDKNIMRQVPRRINEPMINREMRLGMIIQTILKTLVTLIAYAIGAGYLKLAFLPITPSLELAHTMAFITLAASELARAYTSRSELEYVVRLGVFSNPYMQIAVGTSLVGLLAVMYIPFLQPAFDTVPLGLDIWLVLIPLILLPAIASELLKVYLQRLYRREGKLITS